MLVHSSDQPNERKRKLTKEGTMMPDNYAQLLIIIRTYKITSSASYKCTIFVEWDHKKYLKKFFFFFLLLLFRRIVELVACKADDVWFGLTVRKRQGYFGIDIRLFVVVIFD